MPTICTVCSQTLRNCSSCGFSVCPQLLLAKGLAGSLSASDYIGSAQPQYRCTACVEKFVLNPDVKAFLVREYGLDEASMLFLEFYVEEHKLLFQLVNGALHFYGQRNNPSNALMPFAQSEHAQRIAKLVACQRSIVHRDVEFLAAKVHLLEAQLKRLLLEREDHARGGDVADNRKNHSESIAVGGQVSRHPIRRKNKADDLARFRPRCLQSDPSSFPTNVESLKEWMRNIIEAYGDQDWGFIVFTMFSDEAGVWQRGTVSVVWEYEHEEKICSFLLGGK